MGFFFLQMSLEELRHADTEVRWQDDDDVNNCPTCNAYFTVMVRKIHCRHCGHIYCDKCLTKTVPSGPRKRVARVCDICHTLLTPNTAPYFSHEPQQSNQSLLCTGGTSLLQRRKILYYIFIMFSMCSVYQVYLLLSFYSFSTIIGFSFRDIHCLLSHSIEPYPVAREC